MCIIYLFKQITVLYSAEMCQSVIRASAQNQHLWNPSHPIKLDFDNKTSYS